VKIGLPPLCRSRRQAGAIVMECLIKIKMIWLRRPAAGDVGLEMQAV